MKLKLYVGLAAAVSSSCSGLITPESSNQSSAGALSSKASSDQGGAGTTTAPTASSSKTPQFIGTVKPEDAPNPAQSPTAASGTGTAGPSLPEIPPAVSYNPKVGDSAERVTYSLEYDPGSVPPNSDGTKVSTAKSSVSKLFQDGSSCKYEVSIQGADGTPTTYKMGCKTTLEDKCVTSESFCWDVSINETATVKIGSDSHSTAAKKTTVCKTKDPATGHFNVNETTSFESLRMELEFAKSVKIVTKTCTVISDLSQTNSGRPCTDNGFNYKSGTKIKLINDIVEKTARGTDSTKSPEQVNKLQGFSEHSIDEKSVLITALCTPQEGKLQLIGSYCADPSKKQTHTITLNVDSVTKGEAILANPTDLMASVLNGADYESMKSFSNKEVTGSGNANCKVNISEVSGTEKDKVVKGQATCEKELFSMTGGSDRFKLKPTLSFECYLK